MHTIIRVEHPSDGEGMFREREKNGGIDKITYSSDNIGQLSERHMLNFPIVYDEIKEFRFGVHFCAYKTIEQIQQWITKEEFKQLIIEYGFKVLMIDVSECIEAEFQCIFEKQHILETKDISSLFI